MELLEGESLAERLSRGPLPLSEVFRYGTQIAEALDRAHRAGVVHRDLKPANVMLTRAGAKLLDFGLAKSAQIEVAADGATQQKPLTQEGTILGTFQYMAPEQLEGLEADPRADIFALGAVLYEMATGQRAFQGSTKTSLIAAIVSQDPKPLASIQPLTPPAFEHTVSRCLAKHPDDRWQSAHDIAEQLRWISEAGSQAGVAAAVATRRRSRVSLAWSLVALLAVALLATSWIGWRAVQRASRDFVFDVSPPAGARFNAVGDESGAIVVSPDGSMVAFSAIGPTGTQLWLRNLATGETKVVAGTTNASFPFWSPDSRNVGFFAGGYLQRVDLVGGAPLRVCPAPGGARGGSWSRSATIIFAPGTNDAIFRVPAAGGTPVAVTRLDPNLHTTHRWPFFLPDGEHFLYLGANHQDAAGRENAIYLGSVDAAPPKLIMPSSSNGTYAGGCLLFTRGETLMAQPMSKDGVLSGEPVAVANDVLYDGGIWRSAFTVSETGLLIHHSGRVAMLSALRWKDRSGKELATIGEPGSFWEINVSPDGRKLGLSIGDPHRQMWVHDLTKNTRTRFAMENAWSGSGVFSPDSSTVYFDAVQQGKGAIYARRVTGGGERLVAESKELAVARSVSPDGRKLLGEDRLGRIVQFSLDRSGSMQLLSEGKSAELHPQFSPDGKWIAFTGDQNDKWDIFVRATSDLTQKWQVSMSGGAFPRWSPDGREIFFIDATQKLNVVRVDPSGTDLVIGQTTPLFPVAGRPGMAPYAIAPDGRILVNELLQVESNNAVAVSDWRRKAGL
jgi:eukaryotic-like serine/threonine-protein kinase